MKWSNNLGPPVLTGLLLAGLVLLAAPGTTLAQDDTAPPTDVRGGAPDPPPGTNEENVEANRKNFDESDPTINKNPAEDANSGSSLYIIIGIVVVILVIGFFVMNGGKAPAGGDDGGGADTGGGDDAGGGDGGGDDGGGGDGGGGDGGE